MFGHITQVIYSTTGGQVGNDGGGYVFFGILIFLVIIYLVFNSILKETQKSLWRGKKKK